MFANQNILYEIAERRCHEYDRRFTGIEEQLRWLAVQPESPQPTSGTKILDPKVTCRRPDTMPL